jgi:hypothetical protein
MQYESKQLRVAKFSQQNQVWSDSASDTANLGNNLFL